MLRSFYMISLATLLKKKNTRTHTRILRMCRHPCRADPNVKSIALSLPSGDRVTSSTHIHTRAQVAYCSAFRKIVLDMMKHCSSGGWLLRKSSSTVSAVLKKDERIWFHKVKRGMVSKESSTDSCYLRSYAMCTASTNANCYLVLFQD